MHGAATRDLMSFVHMTAAVDHMTVLMYNVCVCVRAVSAVTADVKEAWIIFLEKACAQLCAWDEPDPGMQYELCEGGTTYCALQWMTGMAHTPEWTVQL